MFLSLTAVAALAAAAAVIYPPALALIFAPIAVMIVLSAPKGRAIPREWATGLILVAAALLPMWPVWLNLKLGPAPILTPPRLILYALSAFWMIDMIASPLRRGQFRLALKRSRWVTGFVFGFFALGLFSLPLAEGRSLAIPEFFRQSIIWLLPYCATITYVRRRRDFEAIIKIMTLSATAVAGVALIEFATRTLFTTVMSPFISDNAEWLRLAQAQKIRDGVFRAQATHTHPLSLGEHLTMMAPFALAFAISATSRVKGLLWSLALVVLILGALATSSRTALIVAPLAMTISVIIYVRRALRSLADSPLKPLAGLLTVVLIVASPVAVAGVAYLAAGKAGVSTANSSQSRLDQIEMALPKIAKRPVGGYGTGRSARVLGYWGRTLTIDNYYLTLALDLGIPGPLCLIGLFGAVMATAMSRARALPRRSGAIYVGLFGCALVLLVTRSISSQTGNIALMLMIFAAYAGSSVAFSARKTSRAGAAGR
jgi:O-antigen ligase